ncbi:ABC transporter permease [Micromonospora purpureochromogenes]|uniref:ABC transporter permease n=1 Tax=Micromonospora purpureochromogenes TaxID=47872 RepID=UPI0033E6EEB9
MLAAIAFALIWLSVALGLVSDSVETASNLPMFLILLPFLGSGFVPTDTMPAGLRWFADYQAVHAGDRDAARTAARLGNREQRANRAGLVRGDLAAVLPEGQALVPQAGGPLGRLRDA